MMPKPTTVRRVAVILACACLAAGCKRGRDAAAGGPARIDTTNTQWEDGMSAQQVEAEASAMSPEEAAAKGLSVDTSIHLEQLDARDTTAGGGAQPTPAPSAGGSGGTDTTRVVGGQVMPGSPGQPSAPQTPPAAQGTPRQP